MSQWFVHMREGKLGPFESAVDAVIAQAMREKKVTYGLAMAPENALVERKLILNYQNRWSTYFILRNELLKIDRAPVSERKKLEEKLVDAYNLPLPKLHQIVKTVEDAVSQLVTNGEGE